MSCSKSTIRRSRTAFGRRCADVTGVSNLQALIASRKQEWLIRGLAANTPVNTLSDSYRSTLLTAIDVYNLDLVSLQLRLGVSCGNAVDRELPLQRAAEQSHLGICNILVNYGADIDGVGGGIYGETPLALACRKGIGPVVRYLISKGADLYGKGATYEETPLYCAIREGDFEIVELLLENGMDANRFCSGLDKCVCRSSRKRHPTPLMKVCKGDWLVSTEERTYELASLLIKHGAEVNFRPSLDYNTPLQIACSNNETKLAKLLISHGALMNEPCSIPNGFNALQAAIKGENIEMIDLLLLKGANIHLPANSTMKSTAFQVAARGGNTRIVEKMLKAGAVVDEPASTPRGKTAIQEAANMGRLEVLNLLLYHYKGKRIVQVCDDAITTARKAQRDYIVAFLHEYKQQHMRSLVVDRQGVAEEHQVVKED